MLANVRYTALQSNRLRSGISAGSLQVLSGQLTVSNLKFATDRKTRFSYGGDQETILLSENDTQAVTLNYLDATVILQVREWYKSVSGGATFELDLDGVGAYANCILIDNSYTESRIGDTLEYSVPFNVRWL